MGRCLTEDERRWLTHKRRWAAIAFRALIPVTKAQHPMRELIDLVTAAGGFPLNAAHMPWQCLAGRVVPGL